MNAKTKTVILKPARKGMQVDKPGFGKLHQLGEDVPWNEFWRKRYRQGRVVFLDPAEMEGLDVPLSALDARRGEAVRAARARVSILEEQLLEAHEELDLLERAAKRTREPASKRSSRTTTKSTTTTKGEEE